MDHEMVEELEEKLEEAIAEVIRSIKPKQLPVVPDRHTMHLMAKAAVTVYEAVVESSGRGR